MEPLRKPLQGVKNIIRFNWHFYLLAIGFFLIAYLLNVVTSSQYTNLINLICILIITVIITSLLTSLYVYDLSGLYKLEWLNELAVRPSGKLVNITAGFDECSILLYNKFKDAELIVYDFYDPLKHTEVSIKRARKAYPSFKNTIRIDTSNLLLQDDYADNIFVMLSAHEIRNEKDRDVFFIELTRILKYEGKIILVEHLRDIPNFLAYNIGFFHFFARSSWCRTFIKAGLSIYKEKRITPFITIFILEKNAD